MLIYFMTTNKENSLELLYKLQYILLKLEECCIYTRIYDNSVTVFAIFKDLQLGKIYRNIIDFARLV